MFREDENVISKADVLTFLSTRLKTAKVCDIIIVIAHEYFQNKENVIDKVIDYYKDRGVKKLVVRSSSKSEDCMETSNAGHFDSVLNVDATSREEIDNAIHHVLSSYIESDKSLEEYITCCDEEFFTEQVLVQTMTEDIVMSGVVFTRDLLKSRPYYMINYDDDGSTDSVTSGKSGKVIYIPHDIDVRLVDKPFDLLIEAIREVMSLCSIDNLDIEFGIDKNDVVYIFQTRPLAAVNGIERCASDEEILAARKKAVSFFNEKGHMFSDMAFWNPSEIIGDNPYPLDYSLYREIITSFIWSAGISAIGYHYINDELMYRLGNKPYISLDYSFAGLIPESLTPTLQEKLKNYYVDRLKEDITAHDKVEFEIVFSVFDFCTEENMDILRHYGFTKAEINEIHKQLFFITNMAMNDYADVYDEDATSLQNMRELRRAIRVNNPFKENDISVLMSYIADLLYSIKSDGTPQFARQARLAFMARSFCKTLVKKGYVDSKDMDAFMLSINTVASDFERDFDAYGRGLMTREDFIRQYGHLRLGTYNIRTDCYAKIYSDSYNVKLGGAVKERPNPRSLDLAQVKRALSDYEMDATPEFFIDFIKKTTENREFFKFEFTKSLSLILELIIRIGEVLGIPREDLSFISIIDMFEHETKDEWLEIINKNKKLHSINSGLIFPEVCLSEKDLNMVKVVESRPNFITGKAVSGQVVVLDKLEDKGQEMDISGKIVVVTKADPGYDWIFTKNIAGFITKYGGAASHMSIRCAEFDIPAAIGCGEKVFNDVCRMERLTLDAGKKRITAI